MSRPVDHRQGGAVSECSGGPFSSGHGGPFSCCRYQALAFTSVVSPGLNGFGTFFRALCAGFFTTLIFIRPRIVQAPTAPFRTWRSIERPHYDPRLGKGEKSALPAGAHPSPAPGSMSLADSQVTPEVDRREQVEPGRRTDGQGRRRLPADPSAIGLAAKPAAVRGAARSAVASPPRQTRNLHTPLRVPLR